MVRKTGKITLLFLFFIVMIGILPFACSGNAAPASSTPESTTTTAKASPQLLQQVALRQEQLKSPTLERLSQMKRVGMRTENIAVQRIYIHLDKELTPSQTEELRSLGIILYTDSWIPPISGHPTGFMLADLPVDKLDALAGKTYVIRLETAETSLEPQFK
jgi:hypothetical protein